MGDSFFLGCGVGQDNTLYAHIKKRGYQVLNVSEMATNPIDYLHKLNLLYKHHLKTKSVFVGLCIENDFLDIGDKQIDNALNYSYGIEPLNYYYSSFIKMERLRYRIRKSLIKLSNIVGKLLSDEHRERVVVHDFEHHKTFYNDWIQFFTDNDQEAMKVMRGSKKNLQKVTAKFPTEDKYMSEAQLNDDSLNNTVKILVAF